MRILILGGTRFAGRHLTGTAVKRDHAVTLFNRGHSDPNPIQGVEQIHGDRDGGLAPLRGREFDAVVDLCGYFQRVVRQSVELFINLADRYLFVSSISVYRDGVGAGYTENAPVRELADPTVEEITDESYGGLKVLCEREVERGFSGRALIVRPGLIDGPLDRSDRFTYWVRRVARGGEVLEACRTVSGSHARFEWVDERTVADTLSWDRARPQDRPLLAGLDPGRERGLLDRWRNRGGAVRSSTGGPGSGSPRRP